VKVPCGVRSSQPLRPRVMREFWSRGQPRSVHRGDHGLGIELRNGSNSEVLMPFRWIEGNIIHAQMACM